MNTPIQGTAADVVKKAGYMIHKYYYEFNQNHDLLARTPSFPFGSPERARLCMQVHDEYVSEVGKKYAEEVADHKAFLMEMAGNDSTVHLTLPAEYHIGICWQK